MSTGNDELHAMTAGDLACAVGQRKLSAVEVAEAALQHMHATNPAINAVVDINADYTMDQARAVDARLQAADTAALPLAGVPVTIKVNVDQAGFATTNGLKLQRDLIAEQDNPVVSNFIKAGAVIIGRTNTPAFSLRWFCRNSLHGHTRNPLNPLLTPGGSSGGAAAAVAAGIGAIAHGTDIAGSVRYPAYACGIHGLRPSLGRVPAWNATAADRFLGGQLMAVSGPLARNISDLSLAFDAMRQGDSRDPWWTPGSEQLPELPKRAAVCLRPDGLDTDPVIIAALHEASGKLQQAGWQVDEVDAPPMRELTRINLLLWMAEMQQGAHEMVKQEQDVDAIFVFDEISKVAAPANDGALLKASQTRLTLIRVWNLFLEQYPLLLCPVSGQLPFPDLEDIKSAEAFADVLEAQLPQTSLPATGLPGLAVTTAINDNKPVGVQLITQRFREDILFEAGVLLEPAGGRPVVTPKVM